MSKLWWVLALRGACALIFGVLALAVPGITLAALIVIFGAYAIVDGVSSLVSAFHKDCERSMRFWMILNGVAGVAAGVIAWIWPAITAGVLLYLIAFWAVVTGLMEIAAAVALRKVLEKEWMLALGGFLSVALGVIMFINPLGGLLAIVWMIGVYAIFFGFLLLGIAFRLEGHKEQPAA